MTANKKVHIFGGGTVAHVASHLAISAPAYGSTAFRLAELVDDRFNNAHRTPQGIQYDDNVQVWLELTRMAHQKISWSSAIMSEAVMETNEDVAARLETLKADPN